MKTSPILVVAVFLELSHLCLCQHEERVVRSPISKTVEETKSATDDEIQPFDDIACSPDSLPKLLTNSSGWFTSPNYPNSYTDNSNCQWLIVSTSDVVILNFEDFSTEESFDAVRIYDGDRTTSPTITGFDGNLNPPPVGIRSSGQFMLVVFTSDEDSVRPGFNASYTSAEFDFTPDPCYALTRPLVTTGYSGTFQSNGYPDRYWNYANCQWLFDSTDPSRTVEVLFDRFSTEPEYDIVYAYDGNSVSSPVLATLFGGYPPGSIPAIRSSGRYLLVRFLSDNVVSNYPGFNGTYYSIPSPTPTETPYPTEETDHTTDFSTEYFTPTPTDPTEETDHTTDFSTEYFTPTATPTTPEPSCGSILNQSPSDAVVAPGFDLMCHLNRNDTIYVEDQCQYLIQDLPGFGDAEGLIRGGGNFGCAYSIRDDFVGSDQACFDRYQWEARLSNCITCTKLFVCLRFK